MADYYNIAAMFQMIVAPRVPPDYYMNASEQQKEEIYAIQYNCLIRRMQTFNVPITEPSLSPAKGDPSRWVVAWDTDIFDHDGRRLRLPDVPLTVRSRVLRTDQDWASDIDALWLATTTLFHGPRPSWECGTPIYICPSQGWTLQTLKTAAKGILRYEDLIQEMLPPSRRTVRPPHRPSDFFMPTFSNGRPKTTHPCRSNTSNSNLLNSMFHDEAQRYAPWLTPSRIPPPDPRRRAVVMNQIELRINALGTRPQIMQIMQDDPFALWDFSHIAARPNAMLCFRGAPGVRDVIQTKMWFAFAVGFIRFLLSEEAATALPAENTVFNIGALYAWICRCAGACGLPHLPDDYRVLTQGNRQI